MPVGSPGDSFRCASSVTDEDRQVGRVDTQVACETRQSVREVALARGREARVFEHAPDRSPGRPVDVGRIAGVSALVDPVAQPVLDDR